MAVLDNALQALFKMAHWELLWQNASPESSFGEQTITINNINNYDMFYITHITQNVDFDYNPIVGSLVQFTEANEAVLIYSSFINEEDTTATRGVDGHRFLDKEPNSIKFGKGLKTIISSAGYPSVTDGIYVCTPYEIYGRKI